MPKPTPRVFSDELLRLALQRLQAGATTDALRQEFQVDVVKLERALVDRYGHHKG